MDNADQEIDTKQEELRRKKQEKLLAKKAAAREAQNQLYRVSGSVFCLGREKACEGRIDYDPASRGTGLFNYPTCHSS